ncbi:MAG: Eco57I restriction-modification methylase domain-containing protein [gamma proteobacterium endosymbiont of Lamellibrachia anaximandri]|nr:Eco57I restriction-modification methylase domain-containing protein [gamma proteobacterium endosymbiont of Lamellibrachia anaximandri]
MQLAFNFKDDQFRGEVYQWEHSEAEKGQIYTRPEVVDFMLTSIGLNDCENIDSLRILEPSCGKGEFVYAIAQRLINSSKCKPTINQLLNKIVAVDLVGSSLQEAKLKIKKLLRGAGYSIEDISILLENWFHNADFLLEDMQQKFTHVVGNPPYVRVENIPKGLLNEYRRRFSTMTDRADLYIPFFEKSLSLLTNNGKLSFICTDRWTKNTYGKSLRRFISDNYALELFVDLYGVAAFDKEVMTYPAITQIARRKGDTTALIHAPSFTQKNAKEVLKAIGNQPSNIKIRKNIVNGLNPWLLGSSDQIVLIHKLEREHPLLEETGCKVYIGAATGANKIFIVEPECVDIEKNRLLPVITANELKNGVIQWHGKYLVNTYDEYGVVSLNDYPKLASYLNSHKESLCKRHVAKKDTEKWFKTIDRVYEERLKLEKLLIPDISSDPVVIHDKGTYHPNNSIYYICSNEWDLHALRVVLLSNITKMFISSYSTKIANGYLRFQAQHLRKLCIPLWDSIDGDLKNRMIEAGVSNDTASFNQLACEMYGLNKKELTIVGV